MAFCRFCGKELVNGECDCREFQASMGNDNNTQYQEPYQKIKEPFVIPAFKIDLSSFSGFISSLRDQSGLSEPNSNANDRLSIMFRLYRIVLDQKKMKLLLSNII